MSSITDQNKQITKEFFNRAYIKIQKKIHPDISPETARLSAIVNEAKEILKSYRYLIFELILQIFFLN